MFLASWDDSVHATLRIVASGFPMVESAGLLGGILPGIREWLLIGLVVFALFGRVGLPRGRAMRLLQPWSSVQKRQPRPTWVNGLSNRGFVLLLVMAGSAIAAWIVSWSLIIRRSSN